MDLSTSAAFEDASTEVLAYLKHAVPMGLWTVTRFDGERQVLLTTAGSEQYPFRTGDNVAWDQTLCCHMVAGETPKLAPDAMSVPQYAEAEVSKAVPIGSYVGMPIMHPDGDLFGTLCAVDPAPRPADFVAHEGLVSLLASLLGRVLDADVERAAAAQQLAAVEAVADTDPLTGLLNRRGWRRIADVALDRARRFGDPATVFVVDIDNLKTVNDVDGHAAGDQVISRVATVLRSVARSIDSVARIGGDEFAIMAACTPADGERLRERLERTLDAAGLHCSIGSTALDVRIGLDDSIAEADQAMYERKRSRRAAAEVPLAV